MNPETWPGASGQDLIGEVVDKHSALESAHQRYVEEVREAASRLGSSGGGPDLVRESLRDLEAMIQIDVDVPTYASQRAGKTLKVLIKRTIQWYIRYVAVQVHTVGQAMVNFGTTVADRLDEGEDAGRKLGQRLDDLEARVRRLETGREKPGRPG